MDIRSARSFLFVPGTRPQRFEKALTSGAGAVIVDLEDSVGASEKDTARLEVARYMSQSGAQRVVVRINAEGTTWYDDDITMLQNLPGAVDVMVPKAETSEAVSALNMRLGGRCELVALVETVKGVLNLGALTSARGLARIAFGAADFCLDSGIGGEGEELNAVRTSLVLYSRAAGLPSPIDGVTLAVRDLDQVMHDSARARRFGFGGKLCIHPAQIDVVEFSFRPSTAELDWARKVLDAAGDSSSAQKVDGMMIDRPLIERARKIIADSGAD